MSETIASRAILMFCTEPRIWICLDWRSASSTATVRQEDVRIGENYTRPTGILDRKLGLAVLPRDSTNGTREMIAM